MSPSSGAHKAAKCTHLRKPRISHLKFTIRNKFISHKMQPDFCFACFPHENATSEKKREDEKTSSPYASYRTLLPFSPVSNKTLAINT